MALTAETSQARAFAALEGRVAIPVIWALRAARPPLRDALVVAEAAHVGVLSLAGRQFGRDAIPAVLSGRDAYGQPLRGVRQHSHKHIVVGTGDGEAIDRMAVWAPGGFSLAELAVLRRLRLRYRGRWVPLEPAGDHPAFATASRWRTLTPYLPYNHVKARGRNSVEGQILREVVEFRGFPEPVEISVRARRRGSFRLERRKPGRTGQPAPLPHDVILTFDRPIRGPITLGRDAHFSMGAFVPDDPR